MPLRAKSPPVELDAEAEAAGEAGEFDGGGFGNRQDREPEYARPPRRCEEMVRREKSAGECCKHVSSVCNNFIVNSVRGLNIRTHAGLSDSKSHLFGIRAYREIACLPGESAPRCFRPRISLSVSAYCKNAKKIQLTQIHCPLTSRLSLLQQIPIIDSRRLFKSFQWTRNYILCRPIFPSPRSTKAGVTYPRDYRTTPRREGSTRSAVVVFVDLAK